MDTIQNRFDKICSVWERFSMLKKVTYKHSTIKDRTYWGKAFVIPQKFEGKADESLSSVMQQTSLVFKSLLACDFCAPKNGWLQ